MTVTMRARTLREEALGLHEESLRLHEESLRLHKQSLERLEEALRLQEDGTDIQEENAENIQSESSELSEFNELGEFCASCKVIPFSAIFGIETSKSLKRRKICTLSYARAQQDVCRFCRFLVESYELGFDSDVNERIPNGSETLFFTNGSAKEPWTPWYETAGIAADLPKAPFVWLQRGLHKRLIEPLVCITFAPPTQDAANVDKAESGWFVSLPRRRTQKEAADGWIDFNLIKSWLNICDVRHLDRCQERRTFAKRTAQLYLINVHTGLVNVVPGQPRYLALSYVWGRQSHPSHTCTEQRAPAASAVPGEHSSSLASLPTRLPRTIADAIDFVKALGENYLWVDFYCIDQQNPNEQKAQIDNMDTIYQGAYLTLIAQDGSDCHAGLPGMSVPLERTFQPSLRTSTGEFMATYVFSAWDNIGKSPCDHRAWTMQEIALSWRRLVFSRNHITMHCQEEWYHDTMPVDTRVDRVPTLRNDQYFWDNGHGLDLYQKAWNFRTWDELISIYSGRELTYQLDALNACRGALNLITRNTQVSFVYGMPKIDILRALLWKPHHKHCLVRRPGFPSWSWAGWIGRTECAYWIGDMDLYTSSNPVNIIAKPRPRKRMRYLFEAGDKELLHPAKISEYPVEDGETQPTLKIASSVARFKLHLVRKQGTKLKNLRSTSAQEKVAVGDQWTLLDRNGNFLENLAGEHQTFEKTDSFFSVHPEISDMLQEAGLEADFLFVGHWPKIRDSLKSNNWLLDMVSALLIIKNADGTALRVASVVVQLEDWLAAGPRPDTITLV